MPPKTWSMAGCSALSQSKSDVARCTLLAPTSFFAAFTSPSEMTRGLRGRGSPGPIKRARAWWRGGSGRVMVGGGALDLVEWDQRDSPLQAALGEQEHPRLLVVDHDVVQAAARERLERRRVRGVLDPQVRRDGALDAPPIEVAARRVVPELEAAHARRHGLRLLGG